MKQHAAVHVKLIKALHSHCFNAINHMLWMIVDAMHLLFLQAAPEKDNKLKSGGEPNCKHP